MTESMASEAHRDEQAAQAGKNLIQVGRDYVRYIVFQFDSGNWGAAAANLGVLLLIAGGLVNGLLGGHLLLVILSILLNHNPLLSQVELVAYQRPAILKSLMLAWHAWKGA